ncbi:hypothetical protein VW23_017500 [Devosia insulae DS-56]|uniref:Uncharacterized protein n=1 Tax=Devosia insulae DS-56 TaxID=1116389 RepID=A0A1E5XRG8_9HYPH|nr:hypothetical protein [Devosia insulae]OEO31165.1 hypothetical protein VW23_017500 [Devosia insulae DS-56]
MLDAQAYARIVRASALYDLIVTAPFATPWTFTLLGSLLAAIDATLGLPGSIEAPQGLAMLMGNLMGSVVLVWSVARYRLGLPILGRYDAVARLLFAAWQIHALASGMSWVVLPFLAVEIGMGIAQSLPVRRTVPA